MVNRATFIHFSIFIFFILTAAAGVHAEQLEIPGTGASEVILRQLATAFNAESPGSEIIIPPSVGSSRGISLVRKGEYVLCRVAGSSNNHMLDEGLSSLRFARDVIVFAVGARAGVTNLSSQQLADIYLGKITNWQEVGGNDVPVRLLVRNPDETTLQVITGQVDTFRGIRFPGHAKVMYHDYEMIHAFNKYTTAIGWLTGSSLKDVDPSVKPIAINGVVPSLQNVLDGKYTLVVDFVLVYRQGGLNRLARNFMEFVTSKQGNRILINAGLVPVNNNQ